MVNLVLFLQGATSNNGKSFGLEGFWPQTAVGYINLIVGILGLVAIIYGYAKALAAINGLGGRVDKVEAAQKEAAGQQQERDKVWLGMVSSMADLQRQIGEAKHTASQCETNSEGYFIEIGSKISDLAAKVELADKNTHGRLSSIETELRLRNQAQPLYVDKKL